MIPPACREAQGWLAGAALLLTLLALLLPPLPFQRRVDDVLAVVDITGSMNTRDQRLDDRPASRLEVVKQALRRLLAAQPCGSRLGLAVFTERRPFLLFGPVEVCANFPAIDEAIANLDWRMGWEGESHIAQGVYAAAGLADSLHADLLFASDGQEAPPLAWNSTLGFDGRRGAVRGLLLGVGGHAPSPIPKYDDNGREIGFWQPDEVPNENYAAPPPPGAASRPGYNARNAPFGSAASGGHEYLSAIDEPHLRELAAQVGLAYAHLEQPGALPAVLREAGRLHRVRAALDLRWIPAALALAAMLGQALLSWSAARASRGPVLCPVGAQAPSGG